MSLDDRFDRLASLFLGDLEPTSTSGMEAAMGRARGVGPSRSVDMPVITPLVAGNLPVLAHPWLWHVAARLDARPSALIRLAADGVQVAMLNAAGGAESAHDDLAAWLLEAATVARRWFVVPRSGGEIDTVSALGAEEVVVVTGGDEAATAAAYQWVRRLVEAARSAGHAPPLTPLAVVGCEDRTARQVASDVDTSAQSFLGHAVAFAGAFPQLERTSVTHQRFFGESVPPKVLRAAIQEATRAAHVARSPSPASVPVPQSVSPAGPSVPAGSERGDRPEQPASLLPGLWPVAIQCPDHPGIAFATDESGRLHLLAWHEEVAALRAAAIWARRHATLLRAAFPGLAADPMPMVERLLFTDATAAVPWHHAGMRLDLFVRLPDGWLCVPLNNDRQLGG
ncbi:MAG: hypothetical protein ACO32J_02835 [Phycisphaerales bacterium]